MSKAVQFDSYGSIDVLEVRDVPRPVPVTGEVLIEVRAAGINPSEAVIRSGALHHLFPATFPSGQGSDLAGVVAELGPGVSGFAVGDEVIGFSMRRSSQAEYVAVPANQLTPRPAKVPWEVAGSLFVAGVTAYAAVQAVHLVPGDTVVIAGAAGGVGSIAVQLARRVGATVLGIAGPSNDAWLARHGAVHQIKLTPLPISKPLSGSESSQKAARIPQPQRCLPSWPTSSHGVSWKCRLPESSRSTTCATHSDKSNCATHAASWCCDRERTRHLHYPRPVL